MHSSNTNTLFPVFLKLHELNTLIVGGGNVGYEKLNAILTNSPLAKITLVAEVISTEIQSLAGKHSQIEIYERAFHENDLQEKDLVIAATNDKNLNEQIKTLAKSNRILVNVADTPALCDF